MSTSMFAAIYLISLGYMIDQLLSFRFDSIDSYLAFVFHPIKTSDKYLTILEFSKYTC